MTIEYENPLENICTLKNIALEFSVEEYVRNHVMLQH